MEKKQTQRKRNECAALGSIRRSYVEVREEWKTSDSYNEGERIVRSFFKSCIFVSFLTESYFPTC